jgi:zinc and cadmium transporter
MSLLGYIIVFSLLGGVLSLSLAGLLLINKKVAAKFARYGMPFSAGALLGAVFLDLLPEGVEQGSFDTLFISALVGILLFFLAERFIRWFHHHHQHEKSDPASALLIVGDTVHNILDGVAIAAAFLVSIPVGIVTTFAVAAHEIPQEIGEFGALLGKGMRRRKVLLINILSSLAATAAAVGTYFLGQTNSLPLGVVFGLSAGFLLYVSLSDIIPALHEHTGKRKLFDWQPLLLLAGVAAVAIFSSFIHA